MSSGIIWLGPAPTRGESRLDKANDVEIGIDQFLYPTIPDRDVLRVLTPRVGAHGNFIFARNGSGVERFFFSPRSHPEIVSKSLKFLGGRSREEQVAWLDRKNGDLGILGGDIVSDALGRVHMIQFSYYAEQALPGDLFEVMSRINRDLFAPRIWVVYLTSEVSVHLCNPDRRWLQVEPLTEVRGFDDLSYLTTTALLLNESNRFYVSLERGVLYPGILNRDKRFRSLLEGTETVAFETEPTALTQLQVWGWDTTQLRWLLRKFSPDCLDNPLRVETTFDKVEDDMDGEGPIEWTYHQKYLWFPTARKLKEEGEPRRTIGMYLDG